MGGLTYIPWRYNMCSVLRWQNHTSSIYAKASRILNFVRRNVYGCSAEAKATAYTTLLEFSLAVWDGTHI